jgi:hypothetical protein
MKVREQQNKVFPLRRAQQGGRASHQPAERCSIAKSGDFAMEHLKTNL